MQSSFTVETSTWGPLPNRWAVGLAYRFGFLKRIPGHNLNQSRIWYPQSFLNYVQQSALAIILGFALTSFFARVGFNKYDQVLKTSDVVFLQSTDLILNVILVAAILVLQYLWFLLIVRYVNRGHFKLGSRALVLLMLLAALIYSFVMRLSSLPSVEYDLHLSTPYEFSICFAIFSALCFLGFDGLRVIKNQPVRILTMLEQRFLEELGRWEEQKKVRLEAGDHLDKLRDIQHFALFRNRSEAKKAAEDLISIGYEVSLAKAGLFKVNLLATREDALDDDFVQAFKAVLFVVEGNGGSYDGFGAEVVE